MPCIEVQGISKSYSTSNGKIQALNNINLDIAKGELFGLIGPDGSGKTSLIRILTTLILPDQGSATVGGYDSNLEFEQVRKIIGYMPGRFSLYQDLSVEENLNFFASVFGTSIQQNYHLVKNIYSHIEPFKKRLVGQLSGGMKQKLALSCAMIHKPQILFLDEPTTGVDAVSRKEFWDILKSLQAEGLSIFVSTPYMDEASLCDRVALIQKGHLLRVDTPSVIVDSFSKVLYKVQSNKRFELLNDLKSWEKVHSCFAFGENYHVIFNINENVEQECYNYLTHKNHTEIVVERIRAGIEDCFMELMELVE